MECAEVLRLQAGGKLSQFLRSSWGQKVGRDPIEEAHTLLEAKARYERRDWWFKYLFMFGLLSAMFGLITLTLRTIGFLESSPIFLMWSFSFAPICIGLISLVGACLLVRDYRKCPATVSGFGAALTSFAEWTGASVEVIAGSTERSLRETAEKLLVTQAYHVLVHARENRGVPRGYWESEAKVLEAEFEKRHLTLKSLGLVGSTYNKFYDMARAELRKMASSEA